MSGVIYIQSVPARCRFYQGIKMSNFFLGKAILSMMIADDKEALLFKCADGDFEVLVDADCCSSTWVEHIELPALGFPATVIAIDDLDLPGSDNDHPDYDCLKVYGCKITTDKGEIIIDYRNASNGYYGGSLCWPDEHNHFYGGVHGQNVSSKNWVEIQE